MISCIEWIPRNVADPKPKRYELSKAERELLAQDAAADEMESENNNSEGDDGDDMKLDDNTNDTEPKVSVPKEEGKTLTATEIIASQKIDPASLPKELRMDDYSDDENDDDGNGNDGTASGGNRQNIGDLLIGNDDAGMMGIDEDGKVEDHVEDDSDNELDDDDDLNDVPDTREYIPTDLKGLEAMSFGGYAGMKEFEEAGNEDDDSDIEDTNLKPDDALVMVAKTEEVSFVISNTSAEIAKLQNSVQRLTIEISTQLIPKGLCIFGNLRL